MAVAYVEKAPGEIGIQKEILCSPLSPERDWLLNSFFSRFRSLCREGQKSDWTVPGFPPLEALGRILGDTRGPRHGNP